MASEPGADALGIAESVRLAGSGAGSASEPPAPGGAAGRLAGAAALIAGLTVASRLVGFVRTLVFSHVVGNTTLGGIYLAANTIPNIIFEIVAGGALAALVVPLLAGPLSRQDRVSAGRVASALLTWVLLALIPLAVLLAALAGPVMRLLKPDADPVALAVGAELLRVFAPQLPLYGVGIVLTGVLQAHHRFAWPVLAPLLSSLTVIGAYLLFALVEPRGVDIGQVSAGGVAVLAVGTTVGVVVLSLCLVPPVRRLGLRWRPGLRFGAGTGRAVRGLALVGLVTVAAQQLALLLAIVLVTPPSAWVLYTLAQTVYLLPWAVLAVPVATSAYPVLARAHATGDAAGYRRTLAGANRSVLLATGFGAAALIGLAGPGAALLGAVSAQLAGRDVRVLAAAIVGFAPGLLGYGLFALHSRALYARGSNRSAALATVLGFGAVMVASLVLSAVLPAGARVPALTWSNSAGMVVLGVVLLGLVGRRAGAGALAGTGRAAGTAVLAGAVAVGAALGADRLLPYPAGVPADVLRGLVGAVLVLVGYLAVALLLDRADVAPLFAAVRRRLRRRAAS